MSIRYFILTTSAVTGSHFDEAVGVSGDERKNDDGLKTVLEVSVFDPDDVGSAFNGETAYTHEEILLQMNAAEWQ